MVKKITKGSRKNNEKLLMIAGPCSVENYEVMDKTVSFLKNLGVEYIRGGAFKPRTSPYSFQGLGMEGVEILKDMKTKYGVKIVSEVLDIRDLEEMINSVDVIQVGSRNMYNYPLLKEIGKTNKTILLKRGISATIEEWLNAAEYIALEGNDDIILCERGIRTFENYTRNTLDLNAVPVVKERTSLRIIVDPSHGTGRRELVYPMSLASIAAGADGLLIEVHPEPENALSDGFQSVNFEEFELIYKRANETFKCVHKR
ncbi:Phospho-2-dehydro-3-deoxyheptonate aldolase [Caloramator mitchellensis]|uniref:Phospho-2-dehydro-3-deoxyheptonate aldolase n=1 Tax=Caloramator mitchellensis TaxID=908809 RepID=A0A0R3JSS0_CALMK|nr:3-deoxy-7-phosphoheptulonate synthase [Caloramator mitchellensis]KRQ86553.1 Phospho-2-dehydro-3-deoxyheptonate aldolase [Caloramator mitchellensis]